MSLLKPPLLLPPHPPDLLDLLPFDDLLALLLFLLDFVDALHAVVDALHVGLCCVGRRVGFRVGSEPRKPMSVGSSDTVGSIVGLRLGLNVGESVGLSVGETDGLEVGSIGERLGLVVGPRVGSSVGSRVGG